MTEQEDINAELDASGKRWSMGKLFVIVLLAYAALFGMYRLAKAAVGPISTTKIFQLQRSGVNVAPNPASLADCLLKKAALIKSDGLIQTTSKRTYKCYEIEQSVVTFVVSTVNRAPTLSGTPPATIALGNAYGFMPTANDPDGDTLTFSIANKPRWATFSTVTGRLAGTPTADDVAFHANLRISVTDGKASVSLPDFSINVTQATTPPPAPTGTGSVTLSWTPPTQNTDGTPLTNLAGYRIYYGTSAAALTQSLQISSPSVTTAVVDKLTPATWFFAVRAYNDTGGESMNSNVGSTAIP